MLIAILFDLKLTGRKDLLEVSSLQRKSHFFQTSDFFRCAVCDVLDSIPCVLSLPILQKMPLKLALRGFFGRFCTTGLPSDIIVEVEEMKFHLHKFPLMSRSGLLTSLVAEAPNDDEERCQIQLPDIPGGPEAFEMAVKFCYGVKIELTAANVAALRCAAEYLEMTEEYGEGNLISKTESFLNQVVIRSWKDSVRTLQSCETLLPQAEELSIIKKCVDSISMKACTDPSLFGWPMIEHSSLQSPGGTALWNGISTGARPKNSGSDWWYEDVSLLSLNLYKRVISAMETKGLRNESIAGAIVHYAKKSLPGLQRRQGGRDGNVRATSASAPTPSSEGDQKVLLETVESLLPSQKGVASTRFLLGLLRTAMILNVSSACKSNLEKRIGVQLEHAALEDLLIPSYSYTSETLYDIECIQRILDHFLVFDQSHEAATTPRSFEGPLIGSPVLSPITMVAKLMDSYLAEVAPDVNLKPAKFQSLAEALPDYSRLLDDGLYRAIDVYLKAHPWLPEQERERLSSIMDCQKLSLEACTHAAQNERLPLRIVVQVLFFEQLQLRTAIAGCFLATDSSDPARHSRHHLADGALTNAAFGGDAWSANMRENQVLKMDMDTIRSRVNELERECSSMRQDIKKVGKSKGLTSSWNAVSKKFGCTFRLQVRDQNERPAVGSLDPTPGVGFEHYHPRKGRHHRNLSLS